jgi:hypothetical protein
MVQKNMFYQHYHGLTCHHPSVHHHRIYMAPLSHHGVLLFFVNTWWDSGIYIYHTITLWYFNIAIENCPFIVGLPIKDGDVP